MKWIRASELVLMGEAVLTIPSRNVSINWSIEPNSDSKIIPRVSWIHSWIQD